jgi:hypothetical protein
MQAPISVRENNFRFQLDPSFRRLAAHNSWRPRAPSWGKLKKPITTGLFEKVLPRLYVR